METNEETVPGEKGAGRISVNAVWTRSFHFCLPNAVDEVGLLDMAVVQLIPPVLGTLYPGLWGTIHQTFYCAEVVTLLSVVERVPTSLSATGAEKRTYI